MEILDFKDIKSWDEKVISAKVDELKRMLFDIKIQSSTSGVEKPHVKKNIKINIARLLTVKSSRSLQK